MLSRYSIINVIYEVTKVQYIKSAAEIFARTILVILKHMYKIITVLALLTNVASQKKVINKGRKTPELNQLCYLAYLDLS